MFIQVRMLRQWSTALIQSTGKMVSMHIWYNVNTLHCSPLSNNPLYKTNHCLLKYSADEYQEQIANLCTNTMSTRFGSM